MNKIENIIKDLKQVSKFNSKKFFIDLINLRMSVCLKSYYCDLIKQYDACDNRLNGNKPLRIAKKILK